LTICLNCAIIASTKEYLTLIKSGGGTDPVKPGNLSCHNQRHDVGANFRGMKNQFREMRHEITSSVLKRFFYFWVKNKKIKEEF